VPSMTSTYAFLPAPKCKRFFDRVSAVLCKDIAGESSSAQSGFHLKCLWVDPLCVCRKAVRRAQRRGQASVSLPLKAMTLAPWSRCKSWLPET